MYADRQDEAKCVDHAVPVVSDHLFASIAAACETVNFGGLHALRIDDAHVWRSLFAGMLVDLFPQRIVNPLQIAVPPPEIDYPIDGLPRRKVVRPNLPRAAGPLKVQHPSIIFRRQNLRGRLRFEDRRRKGRTICH